MTDQKMHDPEKLDLSSLDVPAEKRAELLRLFPEARTEGGSIDFAALERALGETVDPGKERYGLNWPGKADCFKTIQAPSYATLRPAPDESINFETGENLIIEGDNLEVLKLLQKPYLGQIKMIYIDPPYNTGNDFIYPDNYSESLQTYLRYTGQVDAAGARFGTNAESDGRFHSKWLNMMYPRLYLARNLLRDDGLIFISIDDHEMDRLRMLCDEIFGEENFIECLVWKRRYGGGAKEKYIVGVHEYIVVYARDKSTIPSIEVSMSPEQVERYYRLKDQNYDTLGPYRLQPLEPAESMADRPNLRFPVTAPDGTEVWPRRQWLWGREKFAQAAESGALQFAKKDGAWTVSRKQYLKDADGEERLTKQISIVEGIYGQSGTSEIEELFGDSTVFPFPKPSALIALLLRLGLGTGDGIVLDFFAGAGATAQALLERTDVDGSDQKFILVQLPEPTGRKDFPTIADILKERVRRVMKKMSGDNADLLSKTKRPNGFRLFRLSDSNFHEWRPDASSGSSQLEAQLALHVDHIREDRADMDILYELLLKDGYPLTTSVEKRTYSGRAFYSIANGALVICLDRALTRELLDALAESGPERIICLDEGFAGNDQLKTNAVQTFKAKNITFKTV